METEHFRPLDLRLLQTTGVPAKNGRPRRRTGFWRETERSAKLVRVLAILLAVGLAGPALILYRHADTWRLRWTPPAPVMARAPAFHVVDTHAYQVPKTNYSCYKINFKPSPKICVHQNVSTDKFVSATLAHGQPSQKQLLTLFKALLHRDPDLGVFDIGANLGQFSLVAAMMGHQVVAVEPVKDAVDRFRHSVTLNQLSDSITLLHDAVSDSRRLVKMAAPANNRGGAEIGELGELAWPPRGWVELGAVQTILLDDLIPLVTFQRAVLKIDVQRHEPRAILHAQHLLNKVYISYIIMAWPVRRTDDPGRKELIGDMIRVLTENDYSPMSTESRELALSEWTNWPETVIWKHSFASSWRTAIL